ncbi:MAG: ribosome-binding factor A, partial [Bacteroidales bacterium]|nr:ribosome-binding factor A [Bacteroidales bacterium]
GALVSVSGVKISPDLSVARVYLSIYPSDKTETVMATIAENARSLRGELGHKMGKQLRIIPELNFFIDNSLDYVEHLDELLKQ